MRRDEQRLSDILEALDWIAKAVSGRTEDDYIVGLCNILVHEYFGIYWPLVWQTAVDHAPVLRAQIAAIGEA